ncbi:EF-hand domain-containing protein [Devosia sp. 2618]|uniref:EF-hand domain-containing protein n=1 Tax=Devosia sp. 2618 TaxID=3156454 RepID=UPI00339A40FC
MHKIALSLAALALSASAVMAQTPTSFADVDTDGNGELSFVELQVAWPDLTQQEFDAADADNSGGLTPEELNSLQPSAIPATPSGTLDAPAAAPTDVSPGTPETIAN